MLVTGRCLVGCCTASTCLPTLGTYCAYILWASLNLSILDTCSKRSGFCIYLDILHLLESAA